MILQFLFIAKGSVGEVKTQLYVVLDSGLMNNEQFDFLYEKLDRISQLLGGLIRYLKRTQVTGKKYKK